MYRKITSHYSGRCAKCGQPYNKGDLVYWAKGNRSVFHSYCYGSKSPESQTQVIPGQTVTESGDVFSLTIAELKMAALDVLDGKQGSFRKKSFAEAVELLTATSGWAGFTADQLRGWLRSGFKAEAFQNLHAESPPIRKRRKMIYAEEGEMQIDLALSGFDNPFIAWTKRESAPGLSVDVQLGFRGEVSAETITQYETWVARLLYTLESDGFDLDVNVFSIASGYLSDFSRNWERSARGTIRVKVKSEGKISDFTRWSVMFSPAGFRGLIFAARLLHSSSLGMDLAAVGGSVRNPWDVSFDPTTRKLTIYCNATAADFPQEEMDLKVRAFLKKFH